MVAGLSGGAGPKKQGRTKFGGGRNFVSLFEAPPHERGLGFAAEEQAAGGKDTSR